MKSYAVCSCFRNFDLYLTKTESLTNILARARHFHSISSAQLFCKKASGIYLGFTFRVIEVP